MTNAQAKAGRHVYALNSGRKVYGTIQDPSTQGAGWVMVKFWDYRVPRSVHVSRLRPAFR